MYFLEIIDFLNLTQFDWDYNFASIYTSTLYFLSSFCLSIYLLLQCTLLIFEFLLKINKLEISSFALSKLKHKFWVRIQTRMTKNP